jgi:ribose transport system substrate-binding protein
MRRCGLLLLMLSAFVLAAGCGGSNESSRSASSEGKAVAIDVGSKKITVKTSKPRVAFAWASGQQFLKALKRGAESQAEKRGLSLTVFDAKFDAVRQMSQVQNILQQGDFDALMVIAIDGTQMCKVVTKQAPARNIPVVSLNVPLCAHQTKPEGPEMWVPGLITQVGATTTVDSQRWFYQQAAKSRGPGKHVAALIGGAPLTGGALASDAALKEVKATNALPGNFDIKYKVSTNYTTPDAFAKTQTLLRAHPEIDTLLSPYSDIGVGVVKAVNAAGLKGKVKVYDEGASGSALALVRSGDLEWTMPYYPESMGVDAIDAVADAFAGRKVPRWIGQYTQGSKLGKPALITQENIDQFKREY